MKRKPYPKYKASSVELLGDVPEHWEVKKFPRDIGFQEGPGIMAVDFQDEGIPLLRIRNIQGKFVELENCNYLDPIKVEATWKHFKCKKGDLLISGSASTGLVSEVTEEASGSISYTGIIRLWPAKKNIYKDFIRWIVSSDLFDSQVAIYQAGSTIQHFGPEHLRKMSITLPPRPEQQAISAFLDRETERIDTLIGKKQKFVELLKEKRTALISNAVTKGLNPKVKMKPSGIEWLGDVPEHWEIKKLKWIYRGIGSGDGISPDDIESSGAYPVYGGNGIMGYTEKYNANGEDIIIGRVGAKCGNIYVVNGQKWISDNALLLHVNRVCKKYLALVLEERNLNQLANQNAQPLITGSMVGNQFIPIPPFSEQQAIANFLDFETVKIGTLMAKVETAIEKLKEYRTALISAAVTGKINVSTGLKTGVREVA